MFIESPRFPDVVSYGTSGGPEYHTTITVLSGGHERRNIDWTAARHTYDAAAAIVKRERLEEVIAFFHVARGRANGFRFKDWADFKSCGIRENVTAQDQAIGFGNGSNKIFQLTKTYQVGSSTYIRAIKKPVAGTVKIAVNGVAQTTGWSVDAATGLITFSTAPVSGVPLSAGFEFDVPCRFDTDQLSTNFDNYAHGSARIPIIEIRL